MIMMAELFFGIFFNLSLWYKLTDKTIWGTWFSLFGLGVTLAGNIIFVPRYGYMACAWSAFACYGLMMLASYLVGRVKRPVGYDIPRLLGYFAVAMALYGVSVVSTTGDNLVDFAVRSALLLAYGGVVWRAELRPRRGGNVF